MYFKLLVAATIVALIATPTNAELRSVFTVDGDAADASIIAEGSFAQDGTFTARRILYGDGHLEGTVAHLSPQLFQGLAKAMSVADGTFDVMVFVKIDMHGQWQPLWGAAGIVGFHDDTAYAFIDSDHGFRDSGKFRQLPKSRQEFGKSIAETVAIRAAIDAAAARPRGPDRVRSLTELVLKHGAVPALGSGHYFVGSQVAGALRPVDTAEQATLLKSIAQTTDTSAKAQLIYLAGEIPLLPSAFAELSSLVDRSNPRDIRRTAMQSLREIDPAATNERLIPLLDAADPGVLSLLGSISGEEGHLNEKVVDALVKLSAQAAQHQDPRDQSMQYAMLSLMNAYAHPRLMALMYDMAWHGNSNVADVALNDLRNLTGLDLKRDDRDKWDIWWAGAQPCLNATYDLALSTGQIAWCDAYAAADPGTQKILQRLWSFDGRVDETALLKLADEHEHSTAALAALMELWRLRRLSPDSQRRAFEATMKFEFVEGPIDPTNPSYRNVYINGLPTVALPRGLNLNFLADVELDAVPQLPNWHDNIVVPEDCRSFEYGAIGTQRRGQPVARGVLRIRCIDYYHTNLELWSITRYFGPLTLRRTPQ